MRQTLEDNGLKYVFLGRELGARRDEDDCYEDGKAIYRLIRDLPSFRKGIERLMKGIENYRLAIMCAEKQPEDCHRAVLVCRELKVARPYLEIKHILEDGNLLAHESFEDKLLVIHKEGKLLGSEKAYENAYEKQAKKIAYTRIAES